ncbi:MAG: pyruvate kinase, partial [Thermodesulfobacteriota bacterium]
MLEVLVRSGMNVARLNFSYGTHEQHQQKIESLRQIAERVKEPLAILQDLSGPKIRVGEIKAGGVELKKGDRFTLTNRQIMGGETGVTVTYPSLPSEVKPGDRILLSDGTIELQVLSSTKEEVQCQVVVGGILASHNGMNFPNGRIRASAFTEKDREDLLFGIQKGVDFVGLSYVKEASDIERVKSVLKEHSADIPVIAKIERREALENIDEIISVSDGIMIARGDLGVETPIEKISNIQKRLIRKANASGKPVITATQMLRSMVDHTQPTRAEVTDVVNAIYDGTDAVMLSEETARGRFPVESLQMMVKIAESAEEEFPHDQFLKRETEVQADLPQSISHVA